MRVSPQTIINSRFGVGLALTLSRSIPARAGYSIVRHVADWISRRKKWDLVQAARLNQWVVSGRCLSAAELDEVVEATFRHTARCLFDLYHNLHDREAAERMIEFTPEIDTVIQSSQESRQRLVVVGVHMSNFDMVAQAAALRGLRAQAISVERPNKGYQWQNQLREMSGLEITPASKSALRRANQRLKNNGVVLTGLERPLPGSKYHPLFFGRPSPLPVAHIQLALKTHSPVVVAAAIMRTDGIYTIQASNPIELRSYPDRNTEIIANAERILEIAEDFIRQAPYQWSMFFPVWPDLRSEVP